MSEPDSLILKCRRCRTTLFDSSHLNNSDQTRGKNAALAATIAAASTERNQHVECQTGTATTVSVDNSNQAGEQGQQHDNAQQLSESPPNLVSSPLPVAGQRWQAQATPTIGSPSTGGLVTSQASLALAGSGCACCCASLINSETGNKSGIDESCGDSSTLTDSSLNSSSTLEQLLFVDEQNIPDWIREQIVVCGWLKGRIKCKKSDCNARVGAFNFIQRVTCGCHESNLLPAIHISRSRVDILSLKISRLHETP